MSVHPDIVKDEQWESGQPKLKGKSYNSISLAQDDDAVIVASLSVFSIFPQCFSLLFFFQILCFLTLELSSLILFIRSYFCEENYLWSIVITKCYL